MTNTIIVYVVIFVVIAIIALILAINFGYIKNPFKTADDETTDTEAAAEAFRSCSGCPGM